MFPSSMSASPPNIFFSTTGVRAPSTSVVAARNRSASLSS